MGILQFYFAAAAFLIVGYYYTFDAGRYEIAFGFPLILVVLTLLFIRLDARTMELIKIGERLLLRWEERATNETGLPIDLVRAADFKDDRVYGKVSCAHV